MWGGGGGPGGAVGDIIEGVVVEADRAIGRLGHFKKTLEVGDNDWKKFGLNNLGV